MINSATTGSAAIRSGAREMSREKVTAFATESRDAGDGRCFVEAKVTEATTRRLADPLTLRFYFTTAGRT